MHAKNQAWHLEAFHKTSVTLLIISLRFLEVAMVQKEQVKFRQVDVMGRHFRYVQRHKQGVQVTTTHSLSNAPWLMTRCCACGKR